MNCLNCGKESEETYCKYCEEFFESMEETDVAWIKARCEVREIMNEKAD